MPQRQSDQAPGSCNQAPGVISRQQQHHALRLMTQPQPQPSIAIEAVGMALARAMHQAGLGARHLGLVQRCLADAGGGMPASHAPLDTSGTSGANSSTSLGTLGPLHPATGQIRLLRSTSPAACSAGGGDLPNGPHHALGSIFASNQFASVSMNRCSTVLLPISSKPVQR